MTSGFNQIANVNITIASAVVNTTSFDNILIVGALPAVTSEGKTPAVFGAYSSIKEVEEAGWTVSGDSADIVGVAARIAFSQIPAPKVVYIAPIQEAKKAADAIKTAMEHDGWYVACPVGVETSDLEQCAAVIESDEKMMLYTELNAPAGTEITPSVSKTYYRTGGIYGRTDASSTSDVSDANKCMNVAFACSWLSNQSGTETAAFKVLGGVATAKLSSSVQEIIKNANLSYFVTIGGKNVTMVGRTLAGEWCDIIRFRDWIKNDMQTRVANLFLTLPKVPFTDEGISLVQNAMLATLKAGQENGGIMNDEYDGEGNVTRGYVVSVPTVSQVDPSDRAARRLTGCTFKARLAGAIHFAELTGTLAYSL